MWNPFAPKLEEPKEELPKEKKLATIVELDEPNYFPDETIEQPSSDSTS